MSNLQGQTVIVVGGGSGIGRAVAVAASSKGARVVLAGRTRATLEETAALLAGASDVRVLDASVEESVAAFFASVGRFSHLVSTASQGVSGRIAALDSAAIGAAFTAKLWAPVFLVKQGLPHVAPDGSFTFFSGFRAARPAAGTSITSLVNGGLEAFARSMAVELGPVRVNVISPGVVDSGPFWNRLGDDERERLFAGFAKNAPARRVGGTAEQAEAALFAMSNPFLTGAVIPVDGGALLM